LYREMVTLHSIVGYEPSMVLDLSTFVNVVGYSPTIVVVNYSHTPHQFFVWHCCSLSVFTHSFWWT